MNKFQENEERGRKVFREWATTQTSITKYKETTDPFAPYDTYIEWEGVPIIVEIKFRDSPHNRYNTWVLEEKKYNTLMSIRERNNTKMKVLYVNIFNDDQIYAWDVTKSFMKEVPLKLEYHKMTTSGNQTKIPKAVYHLSLNQATNLKTI